MNDPLMPTCVQASRSTAEIVCDRLAADILHLIRSPT